ncbi:MAG: NADH:ubiquinone reductase (Na(+)-transporting) subunit F [Magnetospiraceae bacterium]
MSYQLTIEPLGETIEVEEGQTVLDACLRQGVWLPHACGHGLCGTCKVEFQDGEYDLGDASPFALMDFERDEGRALACTCRLDSDATIEADVDEEEDALYLPVKDYVGEVVEIVDLTPDTKGVHLRLDGDGIEFQPGQYINLMIPGVDGPRPFSIANGPGDKNNVELQIRLVEGGKGTTWVHQTMKVGDKLTMSGPYGQFFVRKSRGVPMVFIAGGSGVSSPKSMVLELLDEGCEQPIYLFHGVRGLKDLYDNELFEGLAAKHDNFTYVPVLSAPDDGDDWDGETGWVHEAAQRMFPDGFEDHCAYLCGPPPMVEASIRMLMQGRLFEEGIFTEKFLTSKDGEETRSPVFKRL